VVHLHRHQLPLSNLFSPACLECCTVRPVSRHWGSLRCTNWQDMNCVAPATQHTVIVAQLPLNPSMHLT
jgi:hypothetical protein